MSGEALTIGEVIGRLAADFPDLTVSKIRYLESGGLISPGRTPAGYRRFSEEDVEKLRWVLAAQRDQYLPLKVIRQHLAADGPRVAADDPEGIVAALTSPAGLGVGEAGEAGGAAGTAGTLGTAPGYGPGPVPGAAAYQPIRDQSDYSGDSVMGDSDAPNASTDRASGSELPRQSSLTPPLPPIPHPRSRAATVADPEFYEAAQSDVGELHLGREGLARTAGVPGSFVADLISYGLLPQAESYGGDAVFVVRAASALTEFGLEPRHLRPLLTGARNTAGLLEGLLPARRHDGVASSGRQAAASRAAARSAEAAAGAVRLYAALLRAELSGSPTPPTSGDSAEMDTAARSASVTGGGGRRAGESSWNPGMPGGPAAR